MRTHTFVAATLVAALAAAAPLASAQDRQRWPSRGGDGGGNSGGGRAASQSGGQGGERSQGQGGGERRQNQGGERSQGQRSAQPRDGDGGRVQQPARESARAEPRAEQPSGGNGRRELAPSPQVRRAPQAQAGTTGGAEVRREGRSGSTTDGRYTGTGRYAVPRNGPVPRYRDGDRRVYVQPRQNYYVYRYPSYRYGYPSRAYYSYRYYDPYYSGDFYWSNHAWQPRTYYYGGGNWDYDLGKLRLDMEPRDAEVYIDGYYAGVVDEFDGRLQGLRLEAGNYRVQVALPGFEPLDFDVHVQPGRTTTYRGELIPERP